MARSDEERILDYVRKVYRHRGVSPSVREITHDLGLRSSTTVYRHLMMLAAEQKLRVVKAQGQTFFLPPRVKLTEAVLDEAYEQGGYEAVKKLVLAA